MLKPNATAAASETPRSERNVSFSGQTTLKHVRSGLKPLNTLGENPIPKYGERERRMSRCVPLRRPMEFNIKRTSSDIETPEPEEILDDEVLFSRLQKMFIFAEEDGRTGLDIEEFKEAMRKTVGRNNTEDEIEMLFMKVDANCDGVVDWGEYVTYNLLEYKEKTLMIEMLREKPFPNEIQEIDSRHRETIIRICYYPSIRKTGSKSCQMDYKHGKYITLSKEGTLGVWTLNMKNIRYYNANQYKDRHTQPWFTDMVLMYNVNMVAISSTDRDITIYDMAGEKFHMRYYVTGFDNCITSMDYWANLNDLDIALLLFGDTSGSVFSMKFETSLRGGPFGAVSGKKNACKRISYPEVSRGFVVGVRSTKFPNVHSDWVNKVQYLPDINCFLSSCQCPQTAMFFGDFTGKRTHAFFKVNKGVLSFDYSSLLNIIVTGGMDYMLRVWNPYVNNKAIVLLKGHSKPVNHVIINDKKNQVISIDKGRSLRVFDLRDQTCLQHLSGRMMKSDPFPFSAVFFNPSMRTTILAANHIVLLEKREEEERYSEVLSHTKPVVGAIYSKVFDSVVTACQDSVVSIWDSNNGDKLMQFVNAHCTVERGVEIPVEITALCFDHNGRRLVTGARNGTVHVWNFNNGSCLQKFELPDNSDVTDLVCTKTRIYVTGWGKTVHIYVDGGGEEHRKSWRMQHKEDILSIAYLSPNIIATGAYDGNMIIWSRETGQVYCRLNAFESVKPITENNNRVSNPVGGNNILDMFENSENTAINTATEEESNIPVSNNWQKKKTKLAGAIGLGLFTKFRDTSNDENQDEDKQYQEACEHPLLQALDPDSFNSLEENKYTRDDYDIVCKQYESAVEKILFLETRETIQKETAVVVTSGAEGWVRFWSIHHEGGLLGQFNAAHRLGESILAMKSDTQDQFLITGDTQGYVKVWGIKHYCTGKKVSHAEKTQYVDELRKKFTFYRVERNEEKKYKETVLSHLKSVFAMRPPPSSSEPERTLRYPYLVNSFRAHVCSIHSVDYVTDREILITASADCSVRLWTVNGQYIGTFGERWKPLPKVVTADYFISQIPADIRRCGSARTLKVMNDGKTPLWHNTLGLIRHLGIERLKKQFEHLQTKEDEEELTRLTTNTSDTSNILGKSYKRTMNHKMRPVLQKFIETPGSVAVYHTLPFSELASVNASNKTIKDIQARRAGALAVNRLRGMSRKKADGPAILNIYNKVVNKPAPSVKRYRVGRIKKVSDRFQDPKGGAQAKSPDPTEQPKSAPTKRGSNKEPVKDVKDVIPIVVLPGSGDASRVEVLEGDEEDVLIARRGSSAFGVSPVVSKVDFKLPSPAGSKVEFNLSSPGGSKANFKLTGITE